MYVDLDSRLAIGECERRLRGEVLPLWRLFAAQFFTQQLRLYGRVGHREFEATFSPTASYLVRTPWIEGRLEDEGNTTRVRGIIQDPYSMRPFKNLSLTFALAFGWFSVFNIGAEWLLNGRLLSPVELLFPAILSMIVVAFAWLARKWRYRAIDSETLTSLIASTLEATEHIA